MNRNHEHPKWLWDLIIAMEKHENEHASGAACLGPVLALIPGETRAQAAAIESYARAATEDALMVRIAAGWNGDMFGLGEPSTHADQPPSVAPNVPD